MNAHICKSITCMEVDMKVCGDYVYRDLFALDDGISWVVGNLKRKSPYKSGEFLFKIDIVDKERAIARRQTIKEAAENTVLLKKRVATSSATGGEEDYVKLLRYLDLSDVKI